MKIEHLEYMIETYRRGSINGAAKNLFFSQSHLSAIIKGMEQEIGYPVFRRTREGVGLTEKGQIFIKSAEVIVKEHSKIMELSTQEPGTMDLALVSTPSPFLLQAFFSFCKEQVYHGPNDSFQETGFRNNIDALISRRAHLGVASFLESQLSKYTEVAEKYNLEMEILKDGIPIFIIMAQNHPLAEQEEVDLDDVQQYPYVADMDLDNDDRITLLNPSESRRVLYVTDRASQYDAIREGNYLCMLIGTDVAYANSHGCACRPLHGYEGGLMLASFKRKDHTLNEREKAFIQYLAEKLKKY